MSARQTNQAKSPFPADGSYMSVHPEHQTYPWCRELLTGEWAVHLAPGVVTTASSREDAERAMSNYAERQSHGDEAFFNQL
jgi:hypothetical protein